MVEMTFNSLMGCHALFLDLLEIHQERLRAHDLPGARTTLKDFKDVLMLHVEDEEKYVLPIFGARVQGESEASEEIFHADHRLLVGLLEDVGLRVSALKQGPDLDSAVAAVLELQESFRRLFLAHADREETFLYPHMDRITTAEERAHLLGLCKLPDPRPLLRTRRLPSAARASVAPGGDDGTP